MQGTVTLQQALLLCVVPYILFDVIKILLAAWVVIPVRKILKKAGF